MTRFGRFQKPGVGIAFAFDSHLTAHRREPEIWPIRRKPRNAPATTKEAIASGDQAAAQAALRAAQPELMRGVTKGVLHKNTVARKMSRLSSRVKALGA